MDVRSRCKEGKGILLSSLLIAALHGPHLRFGVPLWAMPVQAPPILNSVPDGGQSAISPLAIICTAEVLLGNVNPKHTSRKRRTDGPSQPEGKA